MTEENDFYKIMWDQKAKGQIIKHNNPLVAVDELEKQLTEELTAYVTTGQMSAALLDTLTTSNFATIVTKDFIASMNLIVGNEITMGPNATIQWANVLDAPTDTMKNGNELTWTLTNVVKDADGGMRKSAGVTSTWDAQAYTAESYTGGCILSFEVLQSTEYYFVGLNTDPATNASFTSIDYAWYINPSGVTKIFENGADTVTAGTYVIGDVFTITYDGAYIRYYKNAVLARSVAVVITLDLHVDSSIYLVDAVSQFGNIHFGGYSNTSPSLDWVTDWTSQSNLIKGASIVTPKLFAGTNSGTSASPILTGIAIGRDVLGGTNATIGLVAYNANVKTVQINTNGSAVFGVGANAITISTAGVVTIPGALIAGTINGVTITGSTITAINNFTVKQSSVLKASITIGDGLGGVTPATISYSGTDVPLNDVVLIISSVSNIILSASRAGYVQTFGWFIAQDGIQSYDYISSSVGYRGLGRSPAATWAGSIPANGYVDITHGLGYYPLAYLEGSNGTFQITFRNMSLYITRIYNATSNVYTPATARFY